MGILDEILLCLKKLRMKVNSVKYDLVQDYVSFMLFVMTWDKIKP